MENVVHHFMRRLAVLILPAVMLSLNFTAGPARSEQKSDPASVLTPITQLAWQDLNGYCLQ